jgi:hypothetical protein
LKLTGLRGKMSALSKDRLHRWRTRYERPEARAFRAE